MDSNRAVILTLILFPNFQTSLNNLHLMINLPNYKYLCYQRKKQNFFLPV